MVNPTTKVKTTQYPRYLGISYKPQDFDWDNDQNTIWDWTADAKAISELYQKGGHIKTLYNEDKSYFDSFYAQHDDNLLIIEHRQRPLTGLMIMIPDHVIMDHSLDLMINSKDQHSDALSLGIQVGKSSQVTLNLHLSLNDAPNASILIYGTQCPNSQFNLGTELTNRTPQNITLFGQIEVDHDAQSNWTVLPNVMGKLLGTGTINLNHDGGDATFNAVSISASDDQIGLQGKVNHLAPHTKSRIQMRGVLFDHAKINFTSVGNIVNGAFQSDAQQESRLMTIGKNAKGTVNPLLLIDENDVQAGHAASVGQYDDEQWYYLLSRGIKKSKVRKILVHSFINPILSQLNSKLLQNLNRWVERGTGDLK